MKCIVCDRCKKIIENPRHSRVITCARPFKLKPDAPCNGKPPYRGNDPMMNDIIWEKELCDDCLDDLEVFLATEPDAKPDDPADPADPTDPTDPDTPENPDGGDGGEDPPTGAGDGNGETAV